ncbi:hypothetical protein RD792_008421 [Penstemon davidsonii]|uniref:Methyl-CpG-binding domain-containing protein 9 n=1 Tax=Penstemon davidsonii TaxID=160366 RepID=A0ABR0D9Q8_9LAMI|nr:hypothetical protein RD792_008421 [Penstemon davidsonii]
MESDTSSSKMAFYIDLNEAPVMSPREPTTNEEAVSSSGVYVCSVCHRAVSVGRPSELISEKQRKEFKCFRCLLNNGGGGVGRFDINASPPRDDDVADAVGGRDGGDKIEASTNFSFSSHRVTRQLNPALGNIGYNLPKPSSVGIAKSGLLDMLQQKLHLDRNFGRICKESLLDGELQPSHSAASKYPPASPNMVYLQTLRDYIAERKGVLGEGWHVEFEFCDRRCKTSAVYIAPDGSRLKSMEDVACLLGFPSCNPYFETGNGSSGFTFIRNGLTINPEQKESSAFLTAQNCRQRRSILRDMNYHGFLSSSGTIGIKESGFSENISRGDRIHDGFPIQFQDFCLISAGNVDPRPSYHNTSQIWPVGYKCSWHDRITGSLFVCEVANGGDCGPNFKVQRYPCTMHSMPVGSTILSRKKLISKEGDDNLGKDDLSTSLVVDDESISIITLLNEDSPPCLGNYVSTLKNEDGVHNSEVDSSSNSDLECLPQRTGNLMCNVVGLNDIVGEFQVESRLTASVWEMVSQAFIYACHETFKQKGAIQFFCDHDIYEVNNERKDLIDSLSRYCYFGGPGIPPLVQNENEFNMSCEMLLTWLNQDRFGLDADFVQEIIEQLPGVTSCLEYKNLNDRKHGSGLQTTGSGFFQVERKTSNAFGTFKTTQSKSSDMEDILKREPCPSGTPLSSKLPLYLMGDVLQVWELAWRFSEVLGLGQPFSFQELESELVTPWLGSYPLDCGHETMDIGDAAPSKDEKVSRARAAFIGKFSGLLLAKIIGSLLKLLVSELLSKVAAYVCPNFDAGEFKSRRGKKKDLDCLAALRKTKLEILPINELTWHEISRRYILAVLSMEGNLESTEVATRESGKVFHCLRGDGGILCGSLTGVAALEADAVVLADAMKDIFGSLKSKSEIISIYERETDADGAQTIEVKDSLIPEWAQVLEPVRKLPTNVGARIRRCINEALEKKPPEWAKKILEHSISKEVYKGNASGPTKRAVVSLLEKVNSENPQQKAEKKEKVKIKTSVADLITKQCRIVLRSAAAADEDRVFCNLLGRTILNPNDNDDEGRLGCPAMVSRPLDFRTIDLRLAAGAYGGSHESFLDDVREVWCNVHTAFADRSDLIDLAKNLSQKFEDLYEKEVLTLVHKIAEFSNDNGSSGDAIKERDDLVTHICKSSLPRAPWEEGICKVCGMDKDDDNVLLCDKCDSEYHRYCLNPPLLKIPEGNWYCPSCVAAQSGPGSAAYVAVANQCRKRKYQGEFTRKFLEALAQLANLMETKECSEFTVDEIAGLLLVDHLIGGDGSSFEVKCKGAYWAAPHPQIQKTKNVLGKLSHRSLLHTHTKIFFIKFLFDEALNSATIRDHMEQCASRAADLQHKLRSLTSELKILKFKEEILGSNAEKANSGVFNGRGDLKSDASSSLLTVEKGLRGKISEKAIHLSSISGCSTQLEDGSSLNEKSDYNKQPYRPPSRSNNSTNATELLSQSQYQQLVKDQSQQENIFAHAQISSVPSWQNEFTVKKQKSDQMHPSSLSDSQSSFLSTSQVMPGHNFSGSICDPVKQHVPPAPVTSIQESRGHHCPEEADILSPQDNSLKMSIIKNDISKLQDSIASIESELIKVSLRKDFLGRDSNGRVYWAFYWAGARPRIIANGSLTSKERGPEEFIGIPDSDNWMLYESDNEIEKLVGWLRENNSREKELRESILQFQSNKSKDSEYTENHILSRGESNQLVFSGRKALSADLATKAMSALEKRIGSLLGTEAADVHQDLASGASQDGRMHRCECLELLWPSKEHCISCHQSFPDTEKLRQHSMECKSAASVSKKSQPAEETSKRKKSKKRPGTSGILHMSTSDKQNDGSSFAERFLDPDFPFNFEEIKARFIVPNSLKDAMNEIGLIGNGGIPSFLPSGLPYLNDPALTLSSTRINDADLAKMPADLRSRQQSGNEAIVNIVKDNKESNRLSRCGENGLDDEGTRVEKLRSTLMSERDQVSSFKDKSSIFGFSKSSMIRESSSRPLAGRASEILRLLKKNLLDMDAALPEDALRLSRSDQDRRRSWCDFVKSARSIYEVSYIFCSYMFIIVHISLCIFQMVQATIILEDTIKSEYLQNEWWYWSSPSTAAKISTLSALALRIYALDSAICYDKPLRNSAMETLEPKCAFNDESPSDTTQMNPSSPPLQKTPVSDPVENPRTRSRASKRRKEMNG